MQTIVLNDLQTLALGLVALGLPAPASTTRSFSRLGVPTPVIGGVLVAIALGWFTATTARRCSSPRR